MAYKKRFEGRPVFPPPLEQVDDDWTIPQTVLVTLGSIGDQKMRERAEAYVRQHRCGKIATNKVARVIRSERTKVIDALLSDKIITSTAVILIGPNFIDELERYLSELDSIPKDQHIKRVLAYDSLLNLKAAVADFCAKTGAEMEWTAMDITPLYIHIKLKLKEDMF